MFLNNRRFEDLSFALRFEYAGCIIRGSIEEYGCKMAGRHKKLFKQLMAKGDAKDLLLLSPPRSLMTAASPSQRYSRSRSDDVEGEAPLYIERKILIYLITVLNAVHPDYDFSESESVEFSREQSKQRVINHFDSSIKATAPQYASLQSDLWSAIDHEINLNECDIYSYNPDFESGPYEDCLWALVYFFYNKKLRRIVFLSCTRSIIETPYYTDESNSDNDY